MPRRAPLLRLCLAASVARLASATNSRHEQCKDPLYETHWAPKNDIQTLAAFPMVKTNLKVCPSYNQKASCCHQTFESEQHKYFSFWNTMLAEKLYRIEGHREAVVAEARLHGNLPVADRQQYETLLDAYKEVLSARVQHDCFNNLLTYIAGMMCFACKPEWFQYTTFEGDATTPDHVVRVRMARNVCLELWASCEDFGKAARDLDKAVRDSRVARNAPRAVENIDMFMGQQQLCDWMHDQVALHPFRLPTKEDRDTAKRMASGEAGAPPSQVHGPALVSRRLALEKELDVLEEGRLTGLDLSWKSPTSTSSAAALPAGPASTALQLACIISLGLLL